jgi:hypothetical protein
MRTFRFILFMGATLLLWTGGEALAQVEVPDDRLGIVDIVEPRPEVPLVNTALAFTNTGRLPVKVKLEAIRHTGEPAGEGEMEIPAGGLKYFFVSRLIRNSDLPFVGWVAARTSGHLHPTALLLGLGTTDLPAVQQPNNASVAPSTRRYTIIFPVTAAY